LRTLRTRKPEPAAPPPTEPKPEAKPTETDPEPLLKTFLAKEDVSYEEAQQEWVREWRKWEVRQETARVQQAEQQKQTAQLKESFERKLATARAKYQDFDEVTAGDATTGSGLILSPAMQQFLVHHDLGTDVAYELGKNPEEARRIAELHPTLQIAELGAIAHRIAAPPAPENQKPPVSKAPAPPRTVGGSAAPPAKTTAEARTFAEHKALRSGR
jgi:hypothetical protein